jgi:hypothetical protein
MRQSDRVTLRLEVEASWFNGDGVADEARGIAAGEP